MKGATNIKRYYWLVTMQTEKRDKSDRRTAATTYDEGLHVSDPGDQSRQLFLQGGFSLTIFTGKLDLGDIVTICG